MSLDVFAGRIRLYASKLSLESAEVVKSTAKNVLKELAETTPVDTGLAVSNWQVGLGSKPLNTIKPYAEGKNGSTAEVNRTSTYQIGASVIDSYKGSGAIHIVNNAKHIGPLNNGHSKQAPLNFIEIAVYKAKLNIKNVRISFK